MNLTSGNLQSAEASLAYCLENGVREFVVCAGARNAPLVEMLSHLMNEHPEVSESLKLRSFFDERAAAFFALGRIEASAKPVAVLTTSGTAVAELLPATIEAFYQGRPLVLLTADRPKRYRGTGSPQSIEQAGIFGPYAASAVDLEGDLQTLKRLHWDRRRPLHLNICFEEPQSNPFDPEELLAALKRLLSAIDKPQMLGSGAELEKWQAPGEKALWVIGPLSGSERAEALSLLQTSTAPIWAESLSGLTGEAALRPRLLFSEAQVEALLGAGQVEQVIRIGTVPTLRLWRDLEAKRKDLPVLSVTPQRAPWAGLSRPSFHKNLETVVVAEKKSATVPENPVGATAFALRESFAELAMEFPEAEPVLMDALSHSLMGQYVYVGNSLPVRHWDWVSHGRGYADIYGNRGANGIDGQLATFMGWSEGRAGTCWALVGDLTALYDLNALAIDRHDPDQPSTGLTRQRIVVINNGGGMIFQRIFGKDLFLNRHNTRFRGWAQMFGWHYEAWPVVDEDRIEALPDRAVIELLPNNHQTQEFLKRWAKVSADILQVVPKAPLGPS